MRTRCFELLNALLILAAGSLPAGGARAEDGVRYAVSSTAASGWEFVSRTVMTRPSDAAAPPGADHRIMAVEIKDHARRWHLSNRMSVGKTFDGFGIRWEVGEVQLTLTDDGMGARWEF
ncbi:MAG: hypothetical protein P8Y69_10600 [Gammaproteobacteria bacterium]